jgi:hypothetical protein
VQPDKAGDHSDGFFRPCPARRFNVLARYLDGQMSPADPRANRSMPAINLPRAETHGAGCDPTLCSRAGNQASR